MTLLIDADYILYKSAAYCETEIDFGEDLIVVQSKFSDLQRMLEWEFKQITIALASDDLILFFSDSINFRKDIYPDYKGHRNRKKPCGYKRAINWLRESYKVEVMPTLEADDAMGIYATKTPGHMIVSPDKDMRQIPGDLYDFKEQTTITAKEGSRWHLIQTLSGDQTDGYAGCPGIGIKRAEALFEKYGESWLTIVKAYEKAELTEADALMNARLARILTVDDYDFTTASPILWTPSSDL